MTQPATRYVLEVNPRLPKRLARLEELAGNLWYSWDRPTRALFAPEPRAVGRGRPQPEGDAEAHRRAAPARRRLGSRCSWTALNRVLAAFDAYHAEPPFRQNSGGFRPGRPGGVLLRRVRRPREPADLLRRPRRPRRRPLQGGERPPAAVRRRRPALPAGLLRAAHRCATATSAPSTTTGFARPADRAGAATRTAPS